MIKVCPIGTVGDHNTAWINVCLPEFANCDPNPDDGLITDCEKTWNSRRCRTDYDFFMHYVKGDLIQFQVIFRDAYNTDKENPEYGWNDWLMARLYNDDTGQMLSDDVEDFCSREYTGWNGKESIGVLEVDTGAAIFDDVNCWHIEFESRYVEEDVVYIQSTACTEPFCACATCDHYPLVGSNMNNYDGLGYWHGAFEKVVGDYFPFNPYYRLPIEIVQVGTGITKIVNDRETLDFDRRLVYRVGTTKLVPPYILNVVTLGFLSALNIIIDGEYYEADSLEVQRTNEGSEMMWFNFDVYKNERQKRNDC